MDSRSSVTQNAIVISHALMQAGTTCDSFLRQNLDWLGKALCWAKFTAAASTGVLHRVRFLSRRNVTLNIKLPLVYLLRRRALHCKLYLFDLFLFFMIFFLFVCLSFRDIFKHHAKFFLLTFLVLVVGRIVKEALYTDLD